jgi:hypothetical protein
MKKTIGLILSFCLLIACSSSDNAPDDQVDTFDRSVMLTNWADNIIIPAYQRYISQLDLLKTAATSFSAAPSTSTLSALRDQWLEAYLAYQHVSMFEIGPAESISLRNYTNIYPADQQSIVENLETGDYNLVLPSTNDEQGFPALDYLLFGLADTDEAHVEILSTPIASTYLLALVERLNDLGTTVLEEWRDSYRDIFVSNSGSTATSAVNKMANDYIFYYEKALRAGKIGIPAGVFSGTALSNRVEGLYSRSYSKRLFNAALDATESFFKGEHFGSSQTGESLASYLDYLSSDKDGERLSALIINQFSNARSTANDLLDDFYSQVEEDNSKMLMTYDQLQANVILMKVDMFQALNIKVDYVDADGD